MTYERGFPIARLGAALAVSLAGLAGLAWYAGGLLAPPRAEPYIPADQLDVRPLIMTRVMPEYPADIVSGARGRVVLRLFISADGTLDSLQVAHAEPRGVFDQAAFDAFANARFTPGKKNGEAVPSLILIEVTFGD